MIFMQRLACGAALTVLASAMSTAAYAQATTGAIRGQVVDQTGAAVASATVTVTHVPTGSSSTSVTDASGFYSARGLRPGGPYRISAKTADSDMGTANVAAIGVGEAANVDVEINKVGSEVAEFVVTAARAAAPEQGGPSTNFSEADIQSLPSISRDLKDTARLDPFATIDPTNQDALSFAGTNTRFNQLTVDGVRQNDDFGLNNNGYPTQRSPISLDAVEAVNVSVAPYSVINNGFTGGQINAVTKSGGNAFHGSAFYEYSGRDLQGHTLEGVKVGSDFKEETYGATLGGPILKDRLFFFGAYEKFKGRLGFDEGPTGSGASVQIPRLTTTAVDTFVADTKRIYGYDPGGALTGDFPVSDEKWLGKLDWAITDDHRASVTYQRTEGNSLNGSVSSTFAAGNSVTQPRVGLTSNDYNKIEKLEAYTAQLNSNWTDNFSTEFRYSRKTTDTRQLPLGGLSVGEVTVTVTDLPGVAAGAGTPQIRFGADINRHDNYLNVKLETLEAIARYRLGPHEFLFGARTEKDDIYNVFVANSLGSYTFASYAAFLNRTASAFTASGGVDPSAGTVPATLGTARAGAAEFGFRLSSLYAEDRVQVFDNLDVSVGLRFDWYSTGDEPIANTAFFSRNGFTNQTNLDGESVLLPRVSFNWEPMDRLTVAGGIGRFSSTGLNVWLSNPFANTGVSQTNAACPAGPFTGVDLTRAPAGCTFTPGNGDTNALAPGFRIPTVWKGNLSVRYELDLGRFGSDWVVQADYLRSVNENALYWRDARAVQTGVAPDGRPVYARGTTGTTTGNSFDFLLSNFDKGGSESFAFTLAKEWREGLLDGLGFSYIYTYTQAEDANPMTSSIAFSSYTRFGTSDPQRPASATSDYEIRHRHALDIHYAKKFFGDYETSFHLFGQHRSGLPFSYTFANSRTGNFDNDFGYAASSYSGRQANSNALLYVPVANDPKVVYGAGFDVARYQTFLENSGLAKYAGKIAPRNAFRQADVTTFDLRISQEVPAFFPNGAKLEVFMDVENLGNLLNDDWGVLEQYDFHRSVPVVNVSCVGAASTAPVVNCGAPGARYLVTGTGAGGTFVEPVRAFRRETSLWQIKVGAKYKF
ncbi:TonB-dependent receptor [uncultured Phenylobacterium sp.]|uniref:TonB-dependent receptor n=1 Tax=uncultured Phenylobacterium sp. TaxID=349273 RepID=UPI0025EE3331|nr:TonB-dependent receptor [uncultured Phenylobacterium sp.]